MYSVTGTPVVAANIIAGTNPAVKVEIGNTVTVKVQCGASEKTYSGEVLAIELMNAPFHGAREHAIYDGVKTSEYSDPVGALIDNAADVMEVNAILVAVPDAEDPEAAPTHVRVQVARIKEITVG